MTIIQLGHNGYMFLDVFVSEIDYGLEQHIFIINDLYHVNCLVIWPPNTTKNGKYVLVKG